MESITGLDADTPEIAGMFSYDEPADSTSLWKYVPTIHGTIRAMYELSAENGESRSQRIGRLAFMP